jgi:predicted TIM-barrel fold metal-dependent hydrolase
MRLDGHIHIEHGRITGNSLRHRMKKVRIEGGILISIAPKSFSAIFKSGPSTKRLENLLQWSKTHSNLYPFYWINPLEKDAVKQVRCAVKAGVMGFKVICNAFYPSHKHAMETFQAIAAYNKPILFHSGILWDGTPSSKYNRPVEFEALLEIKKLKFSLAHISWPWCDELIAVYGKFQNAYITRPDVSCEMFIDLTPGTPPIYRKNALSTLFRVGYNVQDNVLFGSDCSANDYDVTAVKTGIRTDLQILKKIGVSPQAIKKLFGENLRRFVGHSDSTVHGKH